MKPKLIEASALGLARPAATDADGRFRLTGVGGERVVYLIVAGPRIETTRSVGSARS